MTHILSKLPPLFRNDKILSDIASLFENSRVYFSSLYYAKGNDRYLIEKKEGVPYFEKDWQTYSILRANAKLTGITGNSFLTLG
jgi:hypothetical protein